MESKISQATLIPIGLALIVIGGAAGWVTKTELTIETLGDDRKEYIERSKRVCETLKNIDKRLSVIENKMPRSR